MKSSEKLCWVYMTAGSLEEAKKIGRELIEENLAVEYNGQSKEDIQKEHQVNRVALNRRGFIFS